MLYHAMVDVYALYWTTFPDMMHFVEVSCCGGCICIVLDHLPRYDALCGGIMLWWIYMHCIGPHSQICCTMWRYHAVVDLL